MKDKTKVILGVIMGALIIGTIGFSWAIFTTKTERQGALNIIAANTSCPILSEELDDNNQITIEQGQEKEVTIELSNQSKINVHSLITYSGDGVEVSYAPESKDNLDVQDLAVSESKTIKLYIKNISETSQMVTINIHCGMSSKTLELGANENNVETKHVEGSTCEDPPQLNAPVLGNLIPVRYDGSKWVKADSTNKDNSWYNYCNQEWANAVTVTSSERSTLTNASVGTEIPMDAINTMWVWIPRYEYDTTKLGNDYASGFKATLGEIKVKFLSGTAGESGGNYKLHPAFTFGEKDLEGFWYGKFETSPETTCSDKATCNVDTIKPQIKPGVASWRYIQPAKAFTISRKMTTDITFKEEYGFSGTEDTHMSKNSEWGAVAYLSQSSYGKYGNSLYEGANKEVYQNKSATFITGSSNGTPSQNDYRQEGQYEYDDMTDLKEGKGLAGPGASTTGNITGVYDMPGGATEYVMGVLVDEEGRPRSGYSLSINSGFNGKVCSSSSSCSDYSSGIAFPDKKYYDLYKGTNAATACDDRICYGHALSETSGWYNDYNYFVSATYPWFIRGGYYDDTSGAGVFDFSNNYGNGSVNLSFRLVLVP